MQRIIRTLRGDALGVLIHGFGNLGKSSLAARVAARLSGHRTAVVFGSYHALAIAEQIERAANAIADTLDPQPAKALLAEVAELRPAVAADEIALERDLRRLLTRGFARHPILLVIDDLERVLQPPLAGKEPVEMRTAERTAVAAVLKAFRDAQTRSRLLVTSRFDFALLEESGMDLAGLLVREPLKPMERRERRKQWRAKARAVQQEAPAAAVPQDLVNRALEAGTGNPALQNILTKPLLNGETAAAESAIAAVEHYLATGEHPEEGNAAQAFFQRMSFATYAAALTETQRDTLTAATLFDPEVPIPRSALAAAAHALGVSAPEPAIDRLLALGLLTDWGAMQVWPDTPARPHASINALVRPLTGGLDAASRRLAASAALPLLAEAWRDHEGYFPLDPRSVAACRVALSAETDDAPLLEAAAAAALVHTFRGEHDARAALALARPALVRLDALGHRPDPLLLGHSISAADQAGDTELQDRLLEIARAQEGIDSDQRAQLMGLRADRLVTKGELDAALRLLQDEVVPAVEALDDKLLLAVTKGKIAEILAAEGKLDEALALHLERLRVATELPDLDSIVHIRVSSARIRLQRGDHNTGGLQTIVDELMEAWEIGNQLGQPDCIGSAGEQLGQVLAIRGQPAEAVRVLGLAAAALDKVGRGEQAAAKCRALAARIGGDEA